MMQPSSASADRRAGSAVGDGRASDLHTARSLATRLQVSVAAIRAWCRQGMPSRHLGRLVRFDLAEVLAWFEKREDRLRREKTA